MTIFNLLAPGCDYYFLRMWMIFCLLSFFALTAARMDYVAIYKELRPFGMAKPALFSLGQEFFEEAAELYNFVTFKGEEVESLSDADKTEFHKALCALFLAFIIALLKAKIVKILLLGLSDWSRASIDL